MSNHNGNPNSQDHVQVEHVEIDLLQAHPDNPRSHSRKQIRQIAASIRAFGFRMPVLIDRSSRLICGHARVEACRQLGIDRVPALRVTDLTDAQIRALMIADNRLTEISTWDDRLLGQNLKILSDLDLDFDLECIGFDYGDIEQRVREFESTGDDDDDDDGADDALDFTQVPAVTRAGDLWQLGAGATGHRVLCADSADLSPYQVLFQNERAAMVFTDPPYNLPAREIGQVCAESHGDFAMAAGEMSPEQFTAFLGSVMDQLCRFSETGSIHYLFMDWRHAHEILTAGLVHYTEFKNLCVWVKDRPGMGTFYRNQHELVFVFKNGSTAHRNHFALGQYGRTRSNVWCHSSARNLDAADGDPDGDEALTLHPTIKPVRLIEAAILDCSRRGEIVLDPFLGSGSTLIACEKSQRCCLGIELSARYVDVAIRRWEQWTGLQAVHEESGRTFAELAVIREVEDEDG